MSAANWADAFGDDTPTHEVVRERVPQLKAQAVAEIMWRIVLEDNESIPPTGQFFSINGRTFMLRVGEPADVPEALLNILNDAVMSVPQVDPVSMQIVGYRDKLRFSYRVLSRPR